MCAMQHNASDSGRVDYGAVIVLSSLVLLT
jgi:hypothetical protein